MPQHCKVGFHAGVGGNPTGIGDYMRQLDTARIPLVVKATDGAGIAYEAALLARASGVPHQIMFRQTKPGGRADDYPNTSLSPLDAAREIWTAVLSTMPPELIPLKEWIWIEPVNEVDTHTAMYDAAGRPWLGPFQEELAKLALAGGWKVALSGHNAGQPAVGINGEPNHWTGPMADWLRFASANRDRVAISLHEGKLGDMYAPPESFYPHLIGRFEYLIAACRTLGIVCPDTLISEWAWSYNNMPGTTAAMNDVRWLAEYLAKHTAVKGAFLWNLGSGDQWAELPNKLQTLIAPITAYTLETTFPDPNPEPVPPPQPEPCRGTPRVQYRREYWVVPASLPDETRIAIYANAALSNTTVGPSYDDAGLGDLDNKTAVLWELDPADHQMFTDWYAANYPGTAVQFATIETSPPPPPADYLPVDALSQRDGRWAATVLGEAATSTKTIGNWGCLLVAYTMMANYMELTGTPMTPAQANAYLVSKGAFSAQYIAAGALAVGWPDEVVNEGWMERTDYRMHGRIRAKLDAGIPVPARVDFNPGTTAVWEQHWVLLIGYDNADEFNYWMADPWTGQIGRVQGVYGNLGVIEALFYDRKTAVPDPDPPTTPPTYSYRGPSVSYTPAIHGAASDWMVRDSGYRSLISYLNMPVKHLSNGIHFEDFDPARPFHLVRVFWQPDRAKTPAEAWADVKDGVLAMYARGARKFELFNEPNLPEEGLGTVWADGAAFGRWLLSFLDIMVSNCPEARLYFPGMSPGVPWTNQFAFTNAAWPIVKSRMHGFCMHAYSGNTTDQGTAVSEVLNQVRELQAYLNLQVPLVVSECSVNRAAPDAFRAGVYRTIDAMLREVPGVEACCYYISWWSNDPNRESWKDTAIPALYKGGA